MVNTHTSRVNLACMIVLISLLRDVCSCAYGHRERVQLTPDTKLLQASFLSGKNNTLDDISVFFELFPGNPSNFFAHLYNTYVVPEAIAKVHESLINRETLCDIVWKTTKLISSTILFENIPLTRFHRSHSSRRCPAIIPVTRRSPYYNRTTQSSNLNDNAE
jgi:hypothetical protein